MADHIDIPPRAAEKLAATPEAQRPVPVLAYRCPHAGCRKPAMVTLPSAIKHARLCIHDPAQRTCASCEHDGEDGCDWGARPNGEHLVRGCPEWQART